MRYTKEQLMTMSLTALRNVDIDCKEEESLVQEVINERIKLIPTEQDRIKRDDVPEIMDGETEAYWQKIIDERTAKAKMPIFEEKVEEVTSVDVIPETPVIATQEVTEQSEAPKELDTSILPKKQERPKKQEIPKKQERPNKK
jgi:hypothetical protein